MTQKEKIMKKLLLGSALAAALSFAIALPALAGDEVTIKGDAKCAKCALKEGDKCQTVIQAEGKEGKTVTYYLAENQAAKDFHPNVCKTSKKVTAKGTVKEVNGKQELTLASISATE
jgi:hypothetical protein